MISARVYLGTAPSTLIAGLPHSRSRQWLDQLNETGSGGLWVHVNDTVFSSHPAILQYGNIVRLAIDGTDRFAFIIEQREVDPAPAGELGDRYKRVSGRGVLAMLEDAIVYPESSYIGSYVRQRNFDYTAAAYDDSSWTAAFEIQKQGFQANIVPSWAGYPAGFPAHWTSNPTFWIWSRNLSGGDHPVGISFFRREFTAAEIRDITIYASCDNAFRLFLDGELFLEGDDWKQTYSATKRIAAGTHIVAVEAENVTGAGPGGTSPAGFVCQIRDVVGDGSANAVGYPSGFISSDDSWLALDYPAFVPGMSLGKILDLLLDEAQARGVLPGITWGFTDTLDSEGSTWAEDPDITFDIGTNYLDVIRTLTEQYIDVDISPTLVLSVYNKGALGSNLTGTVNLQVGVHFEEATGSGEDHLTNVILARDTTGLLTQETNPASLGGRRRREAYLETALAPTEERAQAFSEEILDEFAQPSFQISAKVVKTSGPYTTWQPGDTILMPNPAGAAQAATVLSIAVEEDEAGHEVFHAEGVMLDATS